MSALGAPERSVHISCTPQTTALALPRLLSSSVKHPPPWTNKQSVAFLLSTSHSLPPLAIPVPSLPHPPPFPTVILSGFVTRTPLHHVTRYRSPLHLPPLAGKQEPTQRHTMQGTNPPPTCITVNCHPSSELTFAAAHALFLLMRNPPRTPIFSSLSPAAAPLPSGSSDRRDTGPSDQSTARRHVSSCLLSRT